jgi:pimeloyl-ACP methyl ester carboxylesterase
MKQLFLLSGLGADKRVFEFLDLRGYTLHHVVWVKPSPHETLTEYASRLLPQITQPSPVLVGVSFGGMVALEIGSLIPVERIILISSAISPRAIPAYFKFMTKLNIQKLVSDTALKRPNEVLYWLFGITRKEHKSLLAAIMDDTDATFFRWAVESIMVWKGETILTKVTQIHGTKDRILNFHSADYAVSGGGHLIVITNAAEVSSIIKQVLE